MILLLCLAVGDIVSAAERTLLDVERYAAARNRADIGICESKHFVVLCVDHRVDSREVLRTADRSRGAAKLGGQKLLIQVTIADRKAESVVWLAGGHVAGHHRLWLTARPQDVLREIERAVAFVAGRLQ